MTEPSKRTARRLATRMRSVWIYLAIALAMSAVVAFTLPEPVVRNSFLRSFLPSEYLPTLIVLVTVTLASIVNIHVKLTIMTEGADLRPAEQREVLDLRGKANDVARFFLVIPVTAVLMLFLDGALPDQSSARAWTFSCLVGLFFAATAATYEVQRIVIELSELPDRR